MVPYVVIILQHIPDHYLPLLLEPTSSIEIPRGIGSGNGNGLTGLAIMATESV